ncbi:glycoside hydrolase superfamily [Cristinia sonorae]|uniref:Alpha-galactosidase n=1 Tax=Cristinia sonorae TaxID=1940300 RepID=A0A8K0UXQ3_9AGAR|nr:glycoside hydrolase superfamily [Cristinia sonorae]
MSFLAHAMRYDYFVVQSAATAALAHIGVWAQCSGIGKDSCASAAPPSAIPDLISVAAASPTATSAIISAPTAGPSKETGKTPALGWNSWNAYRCNISEAKVLAAANQIVSLGLKDAGYEYVNIDDCWSELTRDPVTKRIVPDPIKFPNGISSVANQVHALGLKIGIYSDAGTETCAGYPASLGFEDIDAATFSEWGIDYLKYDNCNVPKNWTDAPTPPNDDWYESNSAIRYRQMAGALATTQTTRPIQFSLCIWGEAHVWDWGAKVGHSWRMAGDSTPDWSYITSIVGRNAQNLSSIDFFSHNDMDMMEIGNGNLTIEEQRTHFAAWIFMKSPILLGTDNILSAPTVHQLGTLSKDQVAIITNPELLAFHQDTTIGTPATPFGTKGTGPPEFFAGQSAKGTHVFIINTSNNTETKSFAFDDVPGLGQEASFVVHDMWSGSDAGTFNESFSVDVAPHDTVAFLITAA